MTDPKRPERILEALMLAASQTLADPEISAPDKIGLTGAQIAAAGEQYKAWKESVPPEPPPPTGDEWATMVVTPDALIDFYGAAVFSVVWELELTEESSLAEVKDFVLKVLWAPVGSNTIDYSAASDLRKNLTELALAWKAKADL